MKVSIIMAACNQGNFLKETVNSAVQGLEGCKDWEILIIDDHSTDDCCSQVTQTDRIKVHRPEQKLGVSHARHLAGEMVTGDVIITTDTHCNYPRRSLWRLANWAARQRAIIMPAIAMERTADGKHVIQVKGGQMSVSHRGLRIDRPRIQRNWPALFGSIYLMRRDVWDFLGGWIRLPGYWAGEEQMVTLLAYRFGVPIVLVAKHVCTHRYYRDHGVYPFDLPAHHPAEIAHYIHATCLPESYATVWRPILENYYKFQMTSDPAPLRDWIETRAVWSERRVYEVLFDSPDISQHPLVAQYLKELSAPAPAPPAQPVEAVLLPLPTNPSPRRRRRRRV